MKSSYIFFGVLIVIVLYALSKLRQPEVQQIPEFVQSGPLPTSDKELANIQAKVGAFGALASVAQSQTEAALARETTGAQLEATRITSGVQERLGSLAENIKQSLGLAQIGAAERATQAGYETAERQQAAQLETGERLQLAGFDLQRFGLSQEMARYLAGLSAQENLYQLDLSNRLALQQQQQQAVERVAREYRGQSLERAGTYLNAVLAAGNQQPVYNYQSAFGGSRPPTFLQQLTGLAGTIGSFF